MKFITIIFALLFITIDAQSQDSLKFNLNDSLKIDENKFDKTDSWFGLDKGRHFTGSLIGTILMSQVNHRYLEIEKSSSNNVSAGIMFSIGITKELFDSSRNTNIFSWKDLAADAAGIITGLLIMEIK